MTSSREQGSDNSVFRVLCVCTGNVYRSRVAEHALRDELQSRLGPEASRFVITSAGTGATDGRPLTADYLRDLRRLGLHADRLGDTRQLAALEIGTADLILAAERHHRAAALELVPGAMRRAFTLGEFARVAAPAAERAAVGPPSDDGDLAGRARAVVAAAARYRGSVTTSGGDDIADPWGQPEPALDLAARQVRDAVTRAVDALVGAAPDLRR